MSRFKIGPNGPGDSNPGDEVKRKTPWRKPQLARLDVVSTAGGRPAMKNENKVHSPS